MVDDPNGIRVDPTQKAGDTTCKKRDRYDLTFVDPDRRDEVLRRIGVIEAFEKAPGRRNAEQAAQELGINVHHFYRLARVWRETRRADLLPAATHAIKSGFRIDDRIQEILREVGRDHPDAPIGTIERLARPPIEALGLKLPSRPTVRSFVRKLRREWKAGEAAGVGLAIDFCAVGISVPVTGQRTLPIAAVVLDLESSTAVGAALGAEPSAALAARALVDAIDHAPAADIDEIEGIQITLQGHETGDWSQFAGLLWSLGFVLAQCSSKAGRLTHSIYGPRLSTFRLFPKLTGKPPLERRGSGLELSWRDAEDLFRSRLHAAANPARTLSRLPDNRRDVILTALAQFSDSAQPFANT